MKIRFPHTTLRRGTTLIEVLAGLVILSTLLVSLAIARGRFLRQWSEADRRLTAIHEIDHLLEQWLTGLPQSVPLNASGVTEGSPSLIWRTQTISATSAQSLGTVVVRLQMFDRSPNSSPLAKVDFLLRDRGLLAPAAKAGPR